MKTERKEYAGHTIELREKDGYPTLLIDNLPVGYGRMPNGKYYLHEYAYDWTDSLLELAQRFIDYRQKADKIRRERKAGDQRAKGGE